MLDKHLVKILSLLLLLIAGLVVVSTVTLVIRTYVPMPFHDEWDMMTKWVSWQREAGSALGTFHHQHNEHRLVIPRLFFFSDLVLFQGRGGLNQITLIGLFSIYTFVLWRIVTRATSMTGWPRLAVAGGLLVLMFSAMHLENLLWGFQIQFLAVFLFATLAFWCLPTHRGLLGGILLCAATTFTMSNGLLAWPIGLLIGLRMQWTPRQMILYVAAALASILFYFHDFSLNPGHADPFVSLQSPALLLEYAALYLGHPLSLQENGLATVLGGLGLVLAIGLFIAFICDKNNRFFYSTASKALLATSWFVLGTAVLTAAGRLNFGLEHATSGRYALPAVVFWICLATTLGSIGPRNAIISLVLRQVAIFVMATALVSALYNQAGMLNKDRHWKAKQLAAASALISDVYDESALRWVYPVPIRVPKLNEDLASMNLSFHSLPWADLPGRRISEYLDSLTVTHCRGHIDTVEEVDPGINGFRLRGWAMDIGSGTQPEIVIFSADDSKIVGIGFTGWPRPDVEKIYPEVKDSGWFGHARVSPGQHITAYALVEDGRSACRLKGQFVRPQH